MWVEVEEIGRMDLNQTARSGDEKVPLGLLRDVAARPAAPSREAPAVDPVGAAPGMLCGLLDATAFLDDALCNGHEVLLWSEALSQIESFWSSLYFRYWQYHLFLMWKIMRGMRLAWIDEKIAERGITRREVAEAIGLSESQMSKVMAGTRKLSADEADGIRRFFGFPPPDDLVDADMARIQDNIARLRAKQRRSLVLYLESLRDDDPERSQAI